MVPMHDRDAHEYLETRPHTHRFLAAAILLGTGLGGFVDGILLHQILQWHNMLSSKLPPTTLVTMKANMVWDGFFHVAAWSFTLAGIVVLFLAGRQRDVVWSGRWLAGGMAIGWGAFNLLEGLVDHELIGLHHVHPGTYELVWDMAFLLSGVLLLLVGFVLTRRAWRRPRSSQPRRIRAEQGPAFAR